MQIHPYYNFNGTLTQALDYYVEHLGAHILVKVPYMTGPDMPPGMEAKLMHARFEIAGNTVFCSDAPPDRFHHMQSAFLCLNVDSNDEAERLYTALSTNGHIEMPLEETFFAHRFAILRDQFGLCWMIIHEKKP